MAADGTSKTSNLAGTSVKYAGKAVGCAGNACSGFRDFILRGNVVDMAIGIVVGTAFTALVNALVADFITPLISAIWGGTSFNDLYFSVNGSKFMYGHFINQLITFLIICLVVYFLIVVPMNAMMKRLYPKKDLPERPDGCPFCLNEKVPYAAIKCNACCSELPPLPATVLAEIEGTLPDAAEEEIKRA